MFPPTSAALALCASLCAPVASAADEAAIVVRRGMETTFPVSILNGRVAIGAPQVSPVGTAVTKDGEITIGVTPGGLTPYATLHVVEKTAAPIDFVATGFIDRIKIDEIVVRGRLDMPVAERIAAGSLRVSAGRFAVGTGVDTCK
jgi:hypothetical protein